jgi:heme-degrading monooxygenase HmoA
MYGTVARIRLKAGAENAIAQITREEIPHVAGIVFEHIYRTDADPLECFLIVGFESKDAYVANANSPEQHARYLRYRELFAADPEWHDGEIVFSYPG